MAETLDRGVAARLVLKVGQADLPLGGAAAVFAGDLIQPPFQRAAKAEGVVRDRDHLVRLDCPHQPTGQLHLAVVQAEPFIVSPNEPAFVDQ